MSSSHAAPPTPPTPGRPWLNVLAAAAIGVAVAGFAIGVQPGDSARPFRVRVKSTNSAKAPPAPSYLQWRQRDRGRAAIVSSPLDSLRSGFPRVDDPVALDERAKHQAIEIRSQRRAYAGAPPIIPHPIDEQSSASCLACHEHGIQLQGRTAPVMSHRPYSSCMQCHVSMANRLGPAAAGVANSFAGQSGAAPAERAWPGAPPVIPHGTFMRENCASCHGLTGMAGLRTTHPERTNCRQCHVADSAEAPQASHRSRNR